MNDCLDEVGRDLHDLVNSISSIKMGLSMLERKASDDLSDEDILVHMRSSISSAEKILRRMARRASEEKG